MISLDLRRLPLGNDWISSTGMKRLLFINVCFVIAHIANSTVPLPRANLDWFPPVTLNLIVLRDRFGYCEEIFFVDKTNFLITQNSLMATLYLTQSQNQSLDPFP